jgi:hypothetical protein
MLHFLPLFVYVTHVLQTTLTNVSRLQLDQPLIVQSCRGMKAERLPWCKKREEASRRRMYPRRRGKSGVGETNWLLGAQGDGMNNYEQGIVSFSLCSQPMTFIGRSGSETTSERSNMLQLLSLFNSETRKSDLSITDLPTTIIDMLTWPKSFYSMCVQNYIHSLYHNVPCFHRNRSSYCMSPPWEATSRSATKNFPTFYWTTTFIYCILNSPPLFLLWASWIQLTLSPDKKEIIANLALFHGIHVVRIGRQKTEGNFDGKGGHLADQERTERITALKWLTIVPNGGLGTAGAAPLGSTPGEIF